MAAPSYTLKDGGEREQFPTGSQRDTRYGKGRYDLIPWPMIQRLADVYEKGAAKYSDRNWEKGQNLSRYFDSAVRHLVRWSEGLEDEDHLLQAVWNILAIAQTEQWIRDGKLPRELGDFGPLALEDEYSEADTISDTRNSLISSGR